MTFALAAFALLAQTKEPIFLLNEKDRNARRFGRRNSGQPEAYAE